MSTAIQSAVIDYHNGKYVEAMETFLKYNDNEISRSYLCKSFGRTWFTKLKSTIQGSGLLDKYNEDTLAGKLVVCMTLKAENKDKCLRYFGVFEDYIRFSGWMNTKVVVDKYKSFFEVILGIHPQKPHFDVEIEKKEMLDAANDIRDSLVTSILEVTKSLGVELRINRDILLYTSHGPLKRSFHVVIDNYYHQNNNEAKEFYKLVVAKIPEKYREFIDKAVYSAKQQFRILGCQKPGSGRIKHFVEEWDYGKTKVKYEYSQPILNERHKFNMQLSSSLVSYVSNCMAFPVLIVSEEKKKVTYNPSTQISYDTFTAAIKACNDYAKGDIHSNYNVRIEEGKSIIILERKRPSMCIICNRVHEHENPYITIHGPEESVRFHCRRAGEQYKVIGMLKPPQVQTQIQVHYPKLDPEFVQSFQKDIKDVKEEKRQKPWRLPRPNIRPSTNCIKLINSGTHYLTSNLRSTGRDYDYESGKLDAFVNNNGFSLSDTESTYYLT